MIRKSLDSEKPDDLTDWLLAITHFTNREEAIKAFEKYLSSPDGEVLPILSFYGVGGAGKSALVRKLVALMRDSYESLPFVRINFDNSRSRDAVSALTSVRVQLEQDYNVTFPHFDAHRAVLTAREGGPEEALIIAPAALRMAVDFAEAVFGAPATAVRAGGLQLFEHLRRRYREHGFEEWLRKVGGTEKVLQLRALDTLDLIEELIKAFVRDLRDGLTARDKNACRAVLLFDTYEKLWEGIAGGATGPQGGDRDQWVRHLYEYLADANCALLVIAGRDSLELTWPKIDAEWRKADDEGTVSRHLDEYLIGGLSNHHTQEYLARCGIGEVPDEGRPDALQQAIIDCCEIEEGKGALPFFVGLCANIVLEQRDKGIDPDPQIFKNVPRDDVAQRLAQRFLRSLSDANLAELVRKLSLTRWFDYDLVYDFSGDTAWNALQNFSFVEPLPDGRWTLHSIMRRAVRHEMHQQSPEAIRKIHEEFRSYWEKRDETETEDMEAQAWYHWLHLEPQAALEEWRKRMEEALEDFNAARVREFRLWIEGLDLKADRWRETMGTAEWASGLLAIADILYRSRESAWPQTPVISRGIELSSAAVERTDSRRHPDLWAHLQRTKGLLIAESRLYCADDSWYQPALDCFREAQRVWTEESDPLRWAELEMRIGDAHRWRRGGIRIDCVNDAIAAYTRSLEHSTRRNNPLNWAYIQQGLGICYRLMQNYESRSHLETAKKHLNAALEVFTREQYPAEWGETHNWLGAIFRVREQGHKRDNLQEALRHYESALEIRTEEEMPIEFAKTMNNMAWGLMESQFASRTGNLRRAIECFEAGLRIKSKDHSPTSWALTRHSLGRAWRLLPSGDREENLDKAIESCKAALEIRTPNNNARAWALTQYVLGLAFAERRTGGRTTNLSRAIGCFESALEYFTEENEALNWARSQNGLGVVYCLRARLGDEAAAAKAVNHRKAALRVFTMDALPHDWALTQANLGDAYTQAAGGDAQQLDEAIRVHENALAELAEDEYPLDRALGLVKLGSAWRRLGMLGRDDALAQSIQRIETGLAIIERHDAPHLWADATCNYALTLTALGQNQDALDQLEKVLNIEPNHAEAHLAMALALSTAACSHDPDTSVHIQQALETDPQLVAGRLVLDPAFRPLKADENLSSLIAQAHEIIQGLFSSAE